MEENQIEDLRKKFKSFIAIAALVFAVVQLSGMYFSNRYLFNNPIHWHNYFWSFYRFVFLVITAIYIGSLLIKNKNTPEFDSKFLIKHLGYFALFLLIAMSGEIITDILSRALFSTGVLNGGYDTIRNITGHYVSQLIFYFIVYFAIMVFAYLVNGYSYYLSAEKEKNKKDLEQQILQTELKELQLQFLNVQIKPHFIFNAQHTIISLMEQGEIKMASAMLIKLSDLLRDVLKYSNSNFITLKDEIEIVKKYIAIQQMRFSDSYKVAYNISIQLNNVQIPPLLLQPVVENIFHHAFNNKTAGEIIIKAEEQDGHCNISIQDNGIGFNIEKVNDKGIGLINVKKRLEFSYEKAANIEVQSLPHTGTVVIISIPKKMK